MNRPVFHEISGGVAFRPGGEVCRDPEALAGSELFTRALDLYLQHLIREHSPLLLSTGHDLQTDKGREALRHALGALVTGGDADKLPAGQHEKQELARLVNGFYDFWRAQRRFMLWDEAELPEPGVAATAGQLEQLGRILSEARRRALLVLTGHVPAVHRETSAGANAALTARRIPGLLPGKYAAVLEDVPVIRSMALDTPLVVAMDARAERPRPARLDRSLIESVSFDKARWLCYPARLGQLTVLLYFPQEHLAAAAGLANLYEPATDEELEAGIDGLALMGIDTSPVEGWEKADSVVHHDEEHGLVVGALGSGNAPVSLLGFHSLALAVHNVAELQRGHLPCYASIKRFRFRDGSDVTAVLVGDAFSGKADVLEAARSLAAGRLSEMRVVAVEMGSLLVDDGAVKAHGTGTGGLLHFDHLYKVYALEQIDRAVLLDPHTPDAYVAVPVTSMSDVLEGVKVDYLIYVSNAERVDEERPVLEWFASAQDALDVFKRGVAFTKRAGGDWDLCAHYFANPLGMRHWRDKHGGLAREVFESAFEQGVRVGQIRTMTGIPGTAGPLVEEAGRALVDAMLERR